MTWAPLSSVDRQDLRRSLRLRVDGQVTGVLGLVIEGSCPPAAVGDLVEIHPNDGPSVPAEVIGLRNDRALMVALHDLRGVAAGNRLEHLGVSALLPCSDGMLGRIVDAMGRPLDDRGPLPGPFVHRPIYAHPPTPMSRQRIDTPLPVGVRAIDGLLTLGQGQRIGIFAGAGVGKSSLLGMMTATAQADVCVVALIGERGREVVDFIEDVLTETARKRSVLVVATSDQSPLQRTRGAFVATAIAEHFADAGAQVLLVMDSLTRFSMAGRELGLSIGEPPATKGYTPSVFAQLPRLLERAGRFRTGGSITGLYTVLVEGDDLSDPIADAARSILDGHIVLHRDLAARGHYPAIEVLGSVSRVASAVIDEEHAKHARTVRERLADLREAEELISIGAYVPGANPKLDRALGAREQLHGFLRQRMDERSPYPLTLRSLAQVAGGASR